ncbi:spore germination protein [Scopulibacillus cellulosilyticus]|uniref:Spore germination protein n=1 Tax=Scopulibacillus cellulosilyticus TaxID=2665665 RepID=A0ABW2Q1J6_9BACL
MVDQQGHPVSKDYTKNVKYLKDELGVGISFDIIFVELNYANRNMSLFLVDGMTQGNIMHFIMKLLAKLDAGDLEPDPLDKLMKKYLPYVEINTETNLDKVIFWITSGPAALVVEGLDKVIIIDARTYPARNPQEPDVERVVRGARDGFVETIVFNTALTRRRIRDPSLRMSYMSVGRRSKTDICIAYIEDIANPDVVKQIKHSISKIDTDGLPMGEKTVEEFIAGRHYNPYPTVRFTERPDTAAAHLYEGHVLVYVDGSPVVLITPSTLWNQLQHAEDYRQKPVIGSYLRIVRYLAVWLSIFFLPLWYLLATDPTLLHHNYSFITINKHLDLPVFVQLLIVEVGLDTLRMATIHTPTSLGTALGLVAAIMIGQIAVGVGLFASEVVLYMSIAAIGTFATPTYELSLANRLFRVLMLILTALFHVPGYWFGFFFVFVYLTSLKSFYVPYLWPFLPFSFKSMRDVLFRTPLPLKNRRPVALGTKDPDI